MPRRISSLAPDWWDYTTLDDEILDEAARLTPEAMLQLSRPGFRVLFYDTLEDFYLTEALEYINAWKQEHLHFPKADAAKYRASWEGVRCAVMQGGQGEIKHWAFNDPPRREGVYRNNPPTPEEFRQGHTRVVDLHPMTLVQNARTSGGGNVAAVPRKAISVGPVETWKAEKVSIWHAGNHDNPFGLRLTTLMIAKGIADTSVPMSLLADHPNVQFNFYRHGLGTCEVEMH